MKTLPFFHRIVCPALLSGLLLCVGCRADVDLDKVDTTAELDLGVAMPIGSMRVTLGDLLGTETTEHLYYANGTLCFHGDYYKHEVFHPIDFSQYISKAEKRIPLYDVVNAKMDALRIQYPELDIPANTLCGIPGHPLHFSVDTKILLQYDGINNDLTQERIDSASITRALIDGYLREQNLPIPFEWIDTVKLELGKEFLLNGGRAYVLYAKGNQDTPDNADYDVPFPIDLEHFTLDLVRDHSLPPSNTNVVNSSEMTVRIAITIPEDAPAQPIQPDMAMIYGMNVRILDFEAVWGMFAASNHMRDKDEMRLDSILPDWSSIENTRLPLAEPTIHMHVTHRLAGPLFFHGDYLYVRSKTGETRYAEFGDDRSHSMRFPSEEEIQNPTMWLSTDKSTINDSIQFTLVFDQSADHGRIDQLFSIQPERIGWDWNIDFDPHIAQQTRITPNSDVVMDVDVDIPFVFHEGLYIAYKDTLKNLNLSAINLDSLTSNIDSIKNGDVYLNLAMENTIPVDIRVVVRCLDAENNLLIDPNTGEPIRLSDKDTITVLAPTFTQDAATGQFVVASPGKIQNALRINKEQYANMDAIESIAMEVILDDRSLKSTFEQYAPYFKVRITEESQLKVRLGIGARVGVVMNLNKEQ